MSVIDRIVNFFHHEPTPVITEANRLTPSPISILGKLSQPGLLRGKEVAVHNGTVYLRDAGAKTHNPMQHLSAPKRLEAAIRMDAETLIPDGVDLPDYIDFRAIRSNLEAIEASLDLDPIENPIQNALGEIKNLENKKYRGITRRATRYILYQLAQNATFHTLSVGAITLSKTVLGGVGNTILGGLNLAIKGLGITLGTAGDVSVKVAESAASTTTEIIVPNLLDQIPNILGFLAITEGPGLVGRVVQRTAPKELKATYKQYTPQMIQNINSYLFHPSKMHIKIVDGIINQF